MYVYVSVCRREGGGGWCEGKGVCVCARARARVLGMLRVDPCFMEFTN